MNIQIIYLGLSEFIWQGIFGFLSTIIVTATVGFITLHWLSKKEALNQREGEILDNRTIAYLDILDSMARTNERIIIMDPNFDIRNELMQYGIYSLKDRPAVEYPPIFEDREKFQRLIKKLDDFYVNKLHLVSPKSYKRFVYVYLYLSKLDNYYKYLITTRLPDGSFLDQLTIDKILKSFLPKIGIVIDFDMVKMQADFERVLVSELYSIKSPKKPPFKNEQQKMKFFYEELSKSLYAINEPGFFRMLIAITAMETGISLEVLQEHFQPNEHVIMPLFYD